MPAVRILQWSKCEILRAFFPRFVSFCFISFRFVSVCFVGLVWFGLVLISMFLVRALNLSVCVRSWTVSVGAEEIPFCILH